MLAIVLDGGGPAADRFCAGLKLAAVAPSLGGVETLVSQPRRTSHVDLTPAERAALGIDDGMIRISVGLEDLADLKPDFAAAAAARAGGRLTVTPPRIIRRPCLRSRCLRLSPDKSAQQRHRE